MALGMQQATLPVGSVAQTLPIAGMPQTISMVSMPFSFEHSLRPNSLSCILLSAQHRTTINRKQFNIITTLGNRVGNVHRDTLLYCPLPYKSTLVPLM